MQFDLGPLQVGLVFFSANVAYFVTAFVIGPLSDKLVSSSAVFPISYNMELET